MNYITKIKTKTGDKQIDYNSLANLPKEIKIDNKLDVEGQAADSKAVGDALKTKQPIGDYMTPERMPSSLPNPYKIKFTGNAIAEYDGTSEVTVHIASEGEVIKTPVDSTLTNFGEAADAKVTGDKISELKSEIEKLQQSGGSGSSTPGENGGYYTPSVTQVDEGTMKISFSASREGMDEVPDKDIVLPSGTNGKSAYQYAQEGGYTGNEEEFAEKLAQKLLTGSTSELTPTHVYNAVSAGIPVKVQYMDSTYGLLTFTAFNSAETLYTIVSQSIVYYNEEYILAELFGNRENNEWGFTATSIAQKTEIPTDEHINSLIDTKLGVIENGSY